MCSVSNICDEPKVLEEEGGGETGGEVRGGGETGEVDGGKVRGMSCVGVQVVP